MTGEPLASRLRPCGPVLDPEAANRALDAAQAVAARDGWAASLEQARRSLAPVLGASPYLATLVRRQPERLGAILSQAPDARLETILADVAAVEASEHEMASAQRRLRTSKADVHLLTALADVGGAWGLDQVTGALTRFADGVLRAASKVAVRLEAGRGRVAPSAADGDLPGLFYIAMGKFGAFELNYSSDIDFSIFYEPELMPVGSGVEPQDIALRLTHLVVELLQARTPEGYVFRVDLRLRPDPAATPPASPAAAALDYYESLGQNWERASFIKARVAAGDIPRGEAFLAELQPFIWRRNLDYAAIADVQSIKRQIHVHKVDDRLQAKGADVKLGHGGIREIEFFAQTQQLILGGRDPSLRSNRTVDALQALADAGHVSAKVAAELTDAYGMLRALEHRAQMIHDEQTHKLPENDIERRRIAALWGEGDLRRFDSDVGRLLRRVNDRYGELFADGEDLSSRFGSLVFTGVDDDPETLRTLARMGFSSPERVSATIRSWHRGHIAATRSERSRELFTRLTPRLLEACHATGASEVAFRRFGDFFAGLSSGIHIQSLFLAKPKLFELIVRTMALAPQLAVALARRPAALDALLDQTFFGPFEAGEAARALANELARAETGFEAAMNAVRRVHREQTFRIMAQVMSGAATAAQAGPAFADLADAVIRALGPAALEEVTRLGGAFAGQVAVVALGKCGSREMTAGSDLDLMTFYRADDPAGASSVKAWSAETFYARFTQRLIAALSAQTGEGGLYDVDMRLRPSGTAGPVAVSAAAFASYYRQDAETWEFLALTRARVVWASSPDFAEFVSGEIEAALRQPRDPVRTANDVGEMRRLMMRERPPSGFWDLKLSDGGLVDIEFAAEHLQLLAAAASGPLRANTGEALDAIGEAGLAEASAVRRLHEAWTLQQDLSQVLKTALQDAADPDDEPKAFRDLLARTGGARSFPALREKLRLARTEAHRAFEQLIAPAATD
jgi:glutamate-ammonia-ligase adenylyltransferase